LLVKIARYLFPDIATVGAVRFSDAVVAPGMFPKPDPLSTCHWTVGAGLPEAAAVNVAFAP